MNAGVRSNLFTHDEKLCCKRLSGIVCAVETRARQARGACSPPAGQQTHATPYAVQYEGWRIIGDDSGVYRSAQKR